MEHGVSIKLNMSKWFLPQVTYKWVNIFSYRFRKLCVNKERYIKYGEAQKLTNANTETWIQLLQGRSVLNRVLRHKICISV